MNREQAHACLLAAGDRSAAREALALEVDRLYAIEEEHARCAEREAEIRGELGRLRREMNALAVQHAKAVQRLMADGPDRPVGTILGPP